MRGWGLQILATHLDALVRMFLTYFRAVEEPTTWMVIAHAVAIVSLTP